MITPLIVHLLGPTSYGLVSFYATLSLFLAFLDQAITPTLSRELARSVQDPGAAPTLRCLLRTLEVLSGLIAVLLGALVAGGAPLIARYWLVKSGLPENGLIDAIRLMGLTLACQWPAALYSGGFIGLRRQDVLAVARVMVATLQSLGAVFLLAKISASPLVFFAWMAITSAILSIFLRIFLWRSMPLSQDPTHVDFGVLRSVWRFATGNLLIGLTTALLTQASGLIIAKDCTLDQLAAYTLAVSLAGQVSTILVQPVSATLMPHFAHLVAQHDEPQLAREYHRWSQIFAALILPITGTFIVFARPLLQLWLGNDSPLVNPVVTLLPWIAIGTLFNTLMTPPYFLQLANGWTRLSITTNAVALAVTLPALAMTVPRYGPLAAAVVWIGLNLSYYLFMVPYMHRRLLRREIWAWWRTDTLRPMIAVGLVYAGARILTPPDLPRLVALAIAVGVAAFACVVLYAILPSVRSDAIGILRLVKVRLFKIG